MEWWQRFIQLRDEHNLTQPELADKAGIGRSTIAAIETGRRKRGLSPGQMKALGKAYGIPVSELASRLHGGEPQPLSSALRLPNVVAVPVYKDYAFHASSGGVPVEPVELIYRARVKESENRALEGYIVRGYCLLPHIDDGDIIIVDREAGIDHGDIIACQIDGELHVGRLKKIADTLYLENNEGRRGFCECQIAAKVIEVIHRL